MIRHIFSVSNFHRLSLASFGWRTIRPVAPILPRRVLIREPEKVSILSSVSLDGAFLARFARLVHARVRGFAQPAECARLLPLSRLGVLDVLRLARAAVA